MVQNTCQQDSCRQDSSSRLYRLYNRISRDHALFCRRHAAEFQAGQIWYCGRCGLYGNDRHYCLDAIVDVGDRRVEQASTGNDVENEHASVSEVARRSWNTTKPCKIRGCTSVYSLRSRQYPPLCDKHATDHRAGAIRWCIKCKGYVNSINHNCTVNPTQTNEVSPSKNTGSPRELREDHIRLRADPPSINEREESAVFYDACQQEGCNRLYRSDSDFPLCEEHISERYWAGEIWQCIECNRYVSNIDHNCESHVVQDRQVQSETITRRIGLSANGDAQEGQAVSLEDTSSPCELEDCTRPRNNSSDTVPSLCTVHFSDYQEGKIRQCERCQKYSYTDFTSCVECSSSVPEWSEKWAESDADAIEFYVYFLQLNNGRYYAGQTKNLTRRIQRHQNGGVKATAGKDPRLVWYNTVDTRKQAVNLEFQMKQMRNSEITQMITQFNLAIRGHLPNLVTKGDMNNLEQTISKHHVEHQRNLNVAIGKTSTWVIIVGIILAGLIVAFGFWI